MSTTFQLDTATSRATPTPQPMKRLTVPAILALESVRPLSFVGSQFMYLLSPAVTTFLSQRDWDAMAGLLEQRSGIEYVLRVIEQLDRQEQTAA